MASKRRLRRISCSLKRRYDSEGQARSSASSLYRAKGERVWAYKCKWCPGWHVGHEPYRVVQARKARMSEG